ncbi:MAG: NAD(P)-dependent oxidoreductase, partial [Bacteroidia bacterium]|nr:NAD(P)-dependent oxidoreductase [Bacteroidia bacterium]
PIQLSGTDGIKINPVFVDDAVSAITAAIELQGSNNINVAGNEIMSIKEIATVIGEVLGKNAAFEYVQGQPVNLVADITRMKELLVNPSVSFKEGILKLI